MNKPSADSVSGYIARQRKDVVPLLKQMRAAIQAAAPKAQEFISYGMPAYKQGRVLVYFAPAKHHIGFYPTSSGIEFFKKELSKYKGAKGSVQFLLDKPLPIGLIKKIVRYRVKMEVARLSKVCSRGHKFMGPGTCPVCWPGGKKKGTAL